MRYKIVRKSYDSVSFQYMPYFWIRTTSYTFYKSSESAPFIIQNLKCTIDKQVFNVDTSVMVDLGVQWVQQLNTLSKHKIWFLRTLEGHLHSIARVLWSIRQLVVFLREV